MAKYMTCYTLKCDLTEAFTENENWQQAQDACDDYVWQSAPDKKTAIEQHDAKLEEWERDLHAWLKGKKANPNTKTY